MTVKDYLMYGTKITNNITGEIGLLICTWDNVFADEIIKFATCVDPKGEKYNVAMDDISPIEE